MQSTTVCSTSTTFHSPPTVYLLVTFGSAWLVWFPLLVVIVTWGFAFVVAVRLSQALAQKGLREQVIEIGESSI